MNDPWEDVITRISEAEDDARDLGLGPSNINVRIRLSVMRKVRKERDALLAVTRAAYDERDAEQRLADTSYLKGTVGYEFIDGQRITAKSRKDRLLSALPECLKGDGDE